MDVPAEPVAAANGELTWRSKWNDIWRGVGRAQLERPHRALALNPPIPLKPNPPPPAVGGVERRDRLGGLLHEYYRAAADGIGVLAPFTPCPLRATVLRL